MLAIGNGESRKGIDLNNFNDTKVGCNAIIRDFFVDHLVCVDRRMVNEALTKNTTIYTRPDWASQYTANKNVTTEDTSIISDGNETIFNITYCVIAPTKPAINAAASNVCFLKYGCKILTKSYFIILGSFL